MGLSFVHIFIILIGVLILYAIPTILSLVLIKKKNYKKLPATKRYAGFWWRFLAGLIDTIILYVSAIIIGIALYYFGMPDPITYILDFIYAWLYFVILQSSNKHCTLGMRACGIKIHDEHFNRLGFWRLTGRYFTTYLSALILFIGFFMIAFTKRKQGLHDLVARTIHTKDLKNINNP